MNEIGQQVKQAIKTGNKAQARTLLQQAIRHDPQVGNLLQSAEGAAIVDVDIEALRAVEAVVRGVAGLRAEGRDERDTESADR